MVSVMSALRYLSRFAMYIHGINPRNCMIPGNRPRQIQLQLISKMLIIGLNMHYDVPIKHALPNSLKCLTANLTRFALFVQFAMSKNLELIIN